MNRPVRSAPKNQDCQALSIAINGKPYAICGEGQMQYLLQVATDEIVYTAHDMEIKMTPEELAAKVAAWEADCGYCTLEKAMSMMTPEQREEWKNWYRFSGTVITRQN